VPSPILRVGLTGNIAAGKSTVAGWLAEAGCSVLDLDAVGHQCLLPEADSHDDVVAAFGDAILRADGTIDRRALGAIVFADETARRRLEDILHPAIREREQQRADELAAAGEPAILVTEAALLYETGGWQRYHRMVVVTAPDEARRARLLAKGLSENDAARRMASQMEQHRKAELADYVIDNGGELEQTRRRTLALIDRLRGDRGRLIEGEPLGGPPDC
jgi:dephospho-CoA kinase